MKKKTETSEYLFDIIFSIVLIFGLIGCTIDEQSTDYFQCKAKAKKMGFESDWGPVQGCMIKVKGQWIDINKYRIAD